jgi:hypothetical protein
LQQESATSHGLPTIARSSGTPCQGYGSRLLNVPSGAHHTVGCFGWAVRIRPNTGSIRHPTATLRMTGHTANTHRSGLPRRGQHARIDRRDAAATPNSPVPRQHGSEAAHSECQEWPRRDASHCLSGVERLADHPCFRKSSRPRRQLP